MSGRQLWWSEGPGGYLGKQTRLDAESGQPVRLSCNSCSPPQPFSASPALARPPGARTGGVPARIPDGHSNASRAAAGQCDIQLLGRRCLPQVGLGGRRLQPLRCTRACAQQSALLHRRACGRTGAILRACAQAARARARTVSCGSRRSRALTTRVAPPTQPRVQATARCDTTRHATTRRTVLQRSARSMMQCACSDHHGRTEQERCT